MTCLVCRPSINGFIIEKKLFPLRRRLSEDEYMTGLILAMSSNVPVRKLGKAKPKAARNDR